MTLMNEIRKATIDDAIEICNIYNYYVLNTAITFETKAVSLNVMQSRIQGILDCSLPYYVAVEDNHVIGYCYLHPWNNRCSYSSTKEVSIYLDKNVRRQGLGTKLFEHILKNVDHKNIHVLISGICLPNESSVCLHEKFGFKQVSLMKEIGRKFDEWRDVGHWQLIFDK
jgi:L-amino acid N-acyltransferase YncA